MGFSFTFTRTKTGTTDDASPIDTAPSDSNVFEFQARRHDFGEQPVVGWIYYLIFKNSGGGEISGTATVTPYLRDDSDMTWVEMREDLEVGRRVAHISATRMNDAAIYFRITAVSGSSISAIELRAEAI